MHSEALTLTVANTGEVGLTIHDLSEVSSLFSLENVPDLPFTIQPGEYQILAVRFFPGAVGNFTDTLHITHQGSRPLPVPLGGQATASLPTARALSLWGLLALSALLSLFPLFHQDVD